MPPVPPKIASTNAFNTFAIVAAIVVGVTTLIFFFNPTLHHFYPACQFHRLTGLNCPGCGGTRAFYALLHGDVITAFHDNALFVLSLPIFAARGGWFALNYWRGRPNGFFFPPKGILPFLIVLALFGVLRNLPAFAFLSP